jgi:hypothetical protein
VKFIISGVMKTRDEMQLCHFFDGFFCGIVILNHLSCRDSEVSVRKASVYVNAWVVVYIRSFWSVKRTCPTLADQNGRR